MNFGFENEFFLRNTKTGEVLHHIPDGKLPHDAHGTLVEVRSEAFDNPFQVLASYNAKKAELEALVAKHDCELHNITELQLAYRLETAGFHIHFGKAEWRYPLMGTVTDVNYAVDGAPKEFREIIERLDARFRSSWEGVKRHPHIWRFKSHGFEYRRLPATVDPLMVAQVLAEEFMDAAALRAA